MAKKRKKSKNQKVVKFLSQAQLSRLFEIIYNSGNYRDYALFHIAYFCGLRASEIALIRTENINFRAKTIYCERLKGSFSNTVMLDRVRLCALKEHLESSFCAENDFVFQSELGYPISRSRIDQLIKQYGKEARLPNDLRHFHSLKHSIAVHMLSSGVNLKDVQMHLGHTCISSTEIYAKYTAQRHLQAAKIIINSKFIVR